MSNVNAAYDLVFIGAGMAGTAAYRFVRHEPGCDEVLTGTGSVTHLDQNVASSTAPPLTPADLDRLRDMFGQVDSVSGN